MDLGSLRNPFMSELQDPAVRQKLLASIQAEVGDQGPQAKLAYIESVMNRAMVRGQSLAQTISDTNYYPKSTISRLGRTFSQPIQDELNTHINSALKGSNISNFATGNESGNVHSGGAPVTFNPGTGERFVMENEDRGWVDNWGATGPVRAYTPAYLASLQEAQNYGGPLAASAVPGTATASAPTSPAAPSTSYLASLATPTTDNPLDRMNQLLAAMNLSRNQAPQSSGDFASDLVRAIGRARAQGQLEWMGIKPPRAQLV